MTAREAAGAFAIAVGAAFSVAGCSPTSSAPQPNAPGGASRQGELGTMTPRALVDALDHAGLPVPNPLDTTTTECQSTPCLQSIVTDTVRIKSFATTGQAQTFAAERHLYQIATIVVAFAPPLTAAEQQRYRTEIPVLLNR